MKFEPKLKVAGDLIKSEDWNDTIVEIGRLSNRVGQKFQVETISLATNGNKLNQFDSISWNEFEEGIKVSLKERLDMNLILENRLLQFEIDMPFFLSYPIAPDQYRGSSDAFPLSLMPHIGDMKMDFFGELSISNNEFVWKPHQNVIDYFKPRFFRKTKMKIKVLANQIPDSTYEDFEFSFWLAPPVNLEILNYDKDVNIGRIEVDLQGNFYLLNRYTAQSPHKYEIQKWDNTGKLVHKTKLSGTYKSINIFLIGLSGKIYVYGTDDQNKYRVWKYGTMEKGKNSLAPTKNWSISDHLESPSYYPYEMRIDQNENLFFKLGNYGGFIKMDSNGNKLKRFLLDPERTGPNYGAFRIDGKGWLYIHDYAEKSFRLFDNDGNDKGEWVKKIDETSIYTFCVAPNNDLFIGSAGSTGRNYHIVQYNSEGEKVKTWGSSGTGEGQFLNGVNLNMGNNKIYVMDYQRRIIQVFDPYVDNV